MIPVLFASEADFATLKTLTGSSGTITGGGYAFDKLPPNSDWVDGFVLGSAMFRGQEVEFHK